jgi:hypothetical protein
VERGAGRDILGVMRACRVVLAAAIVLSLLLAAPARAAPVVRVDDATRYLELARYLDVFEDTTGRLGLADVTRDDVAARFTEFDGRGKSPNLAYTASALWARFTVENTTDAPLERWIVFDTPSIENIEVFRDGEPPAVQGVVHPRAGRELPRRTYSFRLTLAPHQKRVVHLRTWGHSEVMLPADLWEIGALGASDRLLATYLALGLGILIALALYNAFLFLFVGDRAYLYYAGYVLGVGTWCTAVDGTLLDMMPASVQVMPHAVTIVAVFSGFVLASLFVRRLLDLRATRRLLDRALLATVGCAVLVATTYLSGIIDYRTENVLVRITFATAVLGWMTAAALRWRDGVSAAAYVLFAWAALILLSVVANLSLYGVLPRRTIFALPTTAFAVEAVVLSLALADAMRRYTRQVEDHGREVAQLNEELRHQVAERSRELAESLVRADGNITPAALETGQIVEGRYRVARPLGRGGMGAVYEVERMLDGRRFALKVVTVALSTRDAARLAQEAEIGARLRHENLVPIVDVGIAWGAPFLVMELVEGGSMEEHRARFGDVAWARPIVRQIAASLAELHASGIIHRDLKPANVLLVERAGDLGPVAKISDFGISRLAALGESDNLGPASPKQETRFGRLPSPRELTESGALLGTPLYMAPEAAFGAPRHSSADVFALGVLAYEALTGRAPFPVPHFFLSRSAQPPPDPAPPEGVGEAVAALILACMRVDPAERPTAEKLAAAL